MSLLKKPNIKTIAEMKAENAEKKAADAVDAVLNAEELLADALERIAALEAAGEGNKNG